MRNVSKTVIAATAAIGLLGASTVLAQTEAQTDRVPQDGAPMMAPGDMQGGMMQDGGMMAMMGMMSQMSGMMETCDQMMQAMIPPRDAGSADEDRG